MLFVLGFSLTGCKKAPFPNANNGDFQPNAWLQVSPDDQVTLQIHKVEMGQGTTTGLTTLVAEELNMPPSSIYFEFAGIHPDFRDPQMQMQVTGGSTSIKSSYLPVREAAASVAQLLILAAAHELNVEAGELELEDGKVIHPTSGRSLSFGQLSEIASSLPIPDKITLKPPSEFKYIGIHNRRVDSAVKVDGSALYSIDIDIPNASTAVVVRSPYFGGKLLSYDNEMGVTLI